MANSNSHPRKAAMPVAAGYATECDIATALAGKLDIVGRKTASDGTCYLIVKQSGAKMSAVLFVPLALLGVGKHAQLQELFLKRGFLSVVNQFAPRELSSLLSQAAQACTTTVIDREGLQEFDVAGARCFIVVKSGNCNWFSQKPDGVQVVLTGTAALKAKPEKSLQDFSKSFSEILARNGRMLVILCFALMAMFARLFRVPHLNLAIIGLSSRGKSIAQHFAACVVNGRDEVLTMNSTVIGLNEYMVDHPDQAVYFEDAHGALAAAPLIQGIMDAGNSGGRLRSKRAGTGNAIDPVLCSMIVSAERGVLETARANRKDINSGVFARLLEVHMGQHGIFDDLCGFQDGAALAKHVKAESPKYMGLIGSTLLEHVGADWVKARLLWIKKEQAMRAEIVKAAGSTDINGLNARLLDGLAFATFIGCLLVHYKVISVKRSDVYDSMGMVFREHMERLTASSSPVAQGVIEAVRHFIQTNQGRFLPLAQAADAAKPNGLAGYVKRDLTGQSRFLFFPGVFRDKFIDQFGGEAYGHLRDAGFLDSQKSRHNLMSVRAKFGSDEDAQRQDFVAIRSTILYSTKAD